MAGCLEIGDKTPIYKLKTVLALARKGTIFYGAPKLKGTHNVDI